MVFAEHVAPLVGSAAEAFTRSIFLLSMLPPHLEPPLRPSLAASSLQAFFPGKHVAALFGAATQAAAPQGAAAQAGGAIEEEAPSDDPRLPDSPRWLDRRGRSAVSASAGCSGASLGGNAVGAGPGAAPALSAGLCPCLLSAQSALSKYACSLGMIFFLASPPYFLASMASCSLSISIADLGA
eukprot:CAMPEP_0206140154 /NCGR_PEP_ID=MMETSP1473-20131121/8626_1 /ASSEMBLY_ACC=CAM_ASM_001109 /TAXON_ID=1461547 /ORGANISM="Stichococcus sp, Strain RCC1054" /LENGTH=182 /DNA_ID=CAMNT_0053534213 /DNA_START=1594 /DNA_END=2144 /DNA_ORIENTATION=-